MKKKMGKSRDKIQESSHDTDKNNIKGKELLTCNNPTQQYVLGGAAILPGGKIYFKKY